MAWSAKGKTLRELLSICSGTQLQGYWWDRESVQYFIARCLIACLVACLIKQGWHLSFASNTSGQHRWITGHPRLASFLQKGPDLRPNQFQPVSPGKMACFRGSKRLYYIDLKQSNKETFIHVIQTLKIQIMFIPTYDAHVCPSCFVMLFPRIRNVLILSDTAVFHTDAAPWPNLVHIFQCLVKVSCVGWPSMIDRHSYQSLCHVLWILRDFAFITIMLKICLVLEDSVRRFECVGFDGLILSNSQILDPLRFQPLSNASCQMAFLIPLVRIWMCHAARGPSEP